MPQVKKITSLKTRNSRTRGKKVTKKSVLTRRMKKILDDGEKSSRVIMFKREKHDNFHDVMVSAPSNSLVNINIVEHPLDQYSSPHLLDLSSDRYIERVKPTMDNSKFLPYSDLPAGEILEKLHVFELLSLENSEILRWCKTFWFNLVALTKKPFQKVDFSPKLPLASSRKKDLKLTKFEDWHDVSIVNLFVFIGSGVTNIISMFWRTGDYMYSNYINQYVGKDEIVSFKSREIATEHYMEMVEPEIIEEVEEVEAVRKSNFKINLPHFEFDNIFREFTINRVSLKPLLAFFVLALVITIPVRSYFYLQDAKDTRGQVLGQAEQALGSLELAQGALTDFNFTDAGRYLSSANDDFVSAQKQLNEIKSFLTVLADTLPVNNSYRSGKNLLELGEKMTKAGEYLVSGLEQLTEESDFSLASRALNFRADVREALVQLESAQENLDKVDIGDLPKENQKQFITLKSNLPLFIESLEKSDAVVDFIVNFLGDNDLKRYLIVFQNDNELRATGGFMGSFALADFKNGDIENIKMPAGGTYDVRAGFTELLQAPEPLRLINPKWEFQDSNWWPDWPTSAENIAYFYNKSDGATVDGVIAINSDWLGSLLDVIGPVEMPDYNKTITAANFEMELQESVEIEYEDKRAPKKILGDLAPELVERIFDIDPSKMMGLVTSLNDGLIEKDIMIHLFNEDEQEFVTTNNWDGRIKDTDGDYLSVVATNIGGGKTDGVVDQEIYHKAKISEDGSIIDTVLISRNHFGPIDDNFTNVSNRSYLRVYVPLGSELIHASGFNRPLVKEFKTPDDFLKEDQRLFNEKMALTDEGTLTKVYSENNKTVFGNWLTIEPGESQEILLVYKLPFKVDLTKKEIMPTGFLGKIRATFSPEYSYDSYSLLIQKQSGSSDDNFTGKVEYPNDVGMQIAYPSDVESSIGGSVYSADLSNDLFYFIGLSDK